MCCTTCTLKDLLNPNGLLMAQILILALSKLVRMQSKGRTNLTHLRETKKKLARAQVGFVLIRTCEEESDTVRKLNTPALLPFTIKLAPCHPPSSKRLVHCAPLLFSPRYTLKSDAVQNPPPPHSGEHNCAAPFTLPPPPTQSDAVANFPRPPS